MTLRLGIFACIILLLGACGAPEVPFDRATAGNVKTIGILTPWFPPKPIAALENEAGNSGSLLGTLVVGLIVGGVGAGHASDLQELLQRQKFSMYDEFMQDLQAGLQKAGYTSTYVPLQRESRDFASAYPQGDGKAGAYLDLVVGGWGYVAEGMRSALPYRPVMAVKVRLVSVRNGAVLMQDVVVYNPPQPVAKAVTIAPEPNPQFGTFDELLADPQAMIAGLKTAAAKSADAVVTLLK